MRESGHDCDFRRSSLRATLDVGCLEVHRQLPASKAPHYHDDMVSVSGDAGADSRSRQCLAGGPMDTSFEGVRPVGRVCAIYRICITGEDQQGGRHFSPVRPGVGHPGWENPAQGIAKKSKHQDSRDS